MIYLTRLSHTPVVVNSDLIQHVETTPDTVIALTSGEKILVLESPDEVIARVVAFRRSIFEQFPHSAASGARQAPGFPDAIPTEKGLLSKG
jgi:flagellar protein FlbD